MYTYTCIKLIPFCLPRLLSFFLSFFRVVIRDGRTKGRVKIVPLCEDILSQRNLPFFPRLSHISLSIFLFHSRHLLLVLSDSQCRCRRSSFGSTRLLANVPISEGRMRTTNHRRRGRGERLGRAVRFCALGCFHSFAAPIDGERIFSLETRTIRNYFFIIQKCKKSLNSQIFKI